MGYSGTTTSVAEPLELRSAISLKVEGGEDTNGSLHSSFYNLQMSIFVNSIIFRQGLTYIKRSIKMCEIEDLNGSANIFNTYNV